MMARIRRWVVYFKNTETQCFSSHTFLPTYPGESAQFSSGHAVEEELESVTCEAAWH